MSCANKRPLTTVLPLLLLAAALVCVATGASAAGNELQIRRIDPGLTAKDSIDDLGCNGPLQGNACLGFIREPGVTIVDNAVTRDEVTITNQGVIDAVGLSNCIIQDVNFAVNLTHTDVGDLIIDVERNSLSQQIYFPPGACNAVSLDAIFDDEGPTPANACPAVGMRLQPDDPLSIFDGRRLDGRWAMVVQDVVAQDSGTWNRWALAADVDCDPVASGCTADDQTLCLVNDRFQVTTSWRNAQGASGVGQAIELTPDTGYFWFFNQSNVEMVIKVLDACSFADRFWVFAGGLTNVEVEITVVDTQTSTVKTYSNPLNTPFQPIQDTSAFATCP